MIDASEAHIWWSMEHKFCSVVRFGDWRLYPMLGAHDGLNCDSGASYTQWREELSDAERMRWMTEMALEFLYNGFDPAQVIQEFCKVKQFRDLAKESHMMARVIAAADTAPARRPVIGWPWRDWSQFS